MRDKAWLNTRNIQTSGPAARLDDQHIGPYRVAWVFPKNPLMVQLDLTESLKILLVFHVSLLQHEANNLLPRQHQGPRKTVIVSDGAKKLNVNRILSLKYDRRLKPPLLRYFVDWESDHPSWGTILPSYQLLKRSWWLSCWKSYRRRTSYYSM